MRTRRSCFCLIFRPRAAVPGLGLAIVNRILSDHDAVIRVEDNTPTGARFIVDIPVNRLPLAVVDAAAEPLEDAARSRA